MIENIRSLSREDVGWLNDEFGLRLYPDVAEPQPSRADGRGEEPASALSGAAVEGVAEVIGELVTENTFRRLLEQGREALSRGDVERARRILGEAARLDPDAPQPKRLLEQAGAERPGKADSKQRKGLARWLKP